MGNSHWSFEDSDIADTFDDHVRTQLPWYDLVTTFITGIIENYLPASGVMYAIGASTGNITKSCGSLLKERDATAISIEASERMCKAWNGGGMLQHTDAVGYDYEPFDVAVCFLTAMFMSVSQRRIFFNNLHKAKKDGGVIVLVDKFCDWEGYEGTVFRRITMLFKLENGQTPEQVLEKELSLAGVQRPMTKNEIDTSVQFFQMGEFRGYLL